MFFTYITIPILDLYIVSYIFLGFSEFHDAVTFMRGIMDECTHLKNFSVPVDTSLIISVFAQDDGYVPRDDYDITSIWPGAEVRILNSGHIAAFVLYLGVFRYSVELHSTKNI